MSFIVLSSEQQNLSTNGLTKIEQANSFLNYFQRPIEIPPYSKVALQSIRFQESKSIQIGISDNMHLFIGSELSREGGQELFMEETTSFPIIAPLVSKPSLDRNFQLDEGAYSVEDFVQYFKGYLDKFLVHPEFESLAQVIIHYDNGAFSGYKIKFDQYNTSGTSTIPDKFSPWIPESSNFNASNGNVKRTVSKSGGGSVKFDNLCSAIGTEYQLGLAGGVCDFQWKALGGLYKDFRVGLTRPTNTILPYPPSYLPGASGAFNNFFEYAVEMIDEVFHVYHLVNDGSECFMQEINYDDAVNSSFSGVDYPATRTGHKAVRFLVENENVTIQLITTTDTFITLIAPNATTLLDNTTAPVSQTQWSLFPKIELANQSQEMLITTYQTQGAANTYNKRSWYKGCLDGVFGPSGVQYVNHVDLCDRKNMTFAQDVPYSGLNGSLGVQKAVQLVTGNNLLYDPNTTETNPNNRTRFITPIPNITRLLGFSPFTVLSSGSYAEIIGSSTVFTSLAPPTTLDISKPLLVRLKGLPITTYNGAKSGTSQVIYSVGRYTSDSKGVVYVLPPQLIYIDIGNTNVMSISQLGIDLVDVLENIRSNMTGKTIVTLCIKPKDEKY